jgi:hypothetical protein
VFVGFVFTVLAAGISPPTLAPDLAAIPRAPQAAAGIARATLSYPQHPGKVKQPPWSSGCRKENQAGGGRSPGLFSKRVAKGV